MIIIKANNNRVMRIRERIGKGKGRDGKLWGDRSHEEREGGVVGTASNSALNFAG